MCSCRGFTVKDLASKAFLILLFQSVPHRPGHLRLDGTGEAFPVILKRLWLNIKSEIHWVFLLYLCMINSNPLLLSSALFLSGAGLRQLVGHWHKAS